MITPRRAYLLLWRNILFLLRTGMKVRPELRYMWDKLRKELTRICDIIPRSLYRKNLMFAIVLFFTIVFFAKITFAYDAPIIINEVMWTGSTYSSSDEWIELYNTTDEDIDITNWIIKNAGSAGSEIKLDPVLDKNKPGSDYRYIIPSEEYFLISRFDNFDTRCILNIAPNFIASGLSLANSNNGDLQLINTNQEMIDYAPSSPWPAGDNSKKISMERVEGTSPDAPSAWQDSLAQINLKENLIYASPNSSKTQMFFITDNSDIVFDYHVNIDNALKASVYVEDVIDGDTIIVKMDDFTYKVRLIGIDAPELGQFFYEEAKQYLINNIYDEFVNIYVPKNIDNRFDTYNRLLAVITIDERVINTELLSLGLAKTYYLDNPLIVPNYWINLEYEARNKFIGIWNIDHDLCVVISEFLPDPIGPDTDNEWIEVYNKCDRSVNMIGWFIDDEDGGSKPYMIAYDLVIDPYSYHVFYSSETRITLNNDKDQARLLNPNQIVIDEISYNKPPEGKSYALIEDDWIYTYCPTPGQANQYCSVHEASYKKIDNIADLENIDGQKVVISGVANSKPGDFSKQYFYLEDDTSGAQIYAHGGDFPSIQIGDILTIYATKSDTAFLRLRISADDKIINQGNKKISPLQLSIKNISSKHQGKLIVTTGIITNIYKNYFILQSDSYDIKVEIKGTNPIDFSHLKKYDIISITGVVYITSSLNISILPRSPTDIVHIGGMGGYDFLPPINQIKDIDNLDDKQIIKITGIVNSLPGTIDVRYFYIQDDSGAIAIYNFKKSFPQLSIGDKVEIFGIYEKKQQRIKILDAESVSILSSDNDISTQNYFLTDLDQSVGMLVFVEGYVIKKQAGKLYIKTPQGEAIIFLRAFSAIKSGSFKVGDYIKIYGILKDYKDEFRIVPRHISDLLVHYKLSKNIKNTSKPKKTLVKSAKAVNYSNPFSTSQKSIDKLPKINYNYIYLFLLLILSQAGLYYVVSKK